MIFSTYLYKPLGVTGLGAILIIAHSAIAFAQQEGALPELNSIRTPNSPAFSILGIQPSSVERPNTPSELTLSIDNATEGFAKFPENYSIEFAPFWLGKNPLSLTWQKDTVRSIEESLARTFSVSVATTKKDFSEWQQRSLSYGFRAFLLSGRMNQTSVQKLKRLEKELRDYSRKYSEADADEIDLRNEFQKKLAEAVSEEQRNEVLAWYNASRNELSKKKLERFKKASENEANVFAPQRVGLIVEIAFAGAYGNDTISDNLAKSGHAFWITPAYVTNDYSLVGVYRFLKDSVGNKSTEYGIRFIYSKSRYAISLEYLKGEYQNSIPLPNRERLSILAEYLLDKNFWLTLSFGNDNKNFQGTTSLFSSLGVRYNFGGKRYSLSP